jgi:hypothetical protein
MKKTYIDPPSGWKYGFPKILPTPRPENLKEWLIQIGYPKELIESYGEHFYTRSWQEEE